MTDDLTAGILDLLLNADTEEQALAVLEDFEAASPPPTVPTGPVVFSRDGRGICPDVPRQGNFIASLR